jgi:large subunit ribosomal protein L30
MVNSQILGTMKQLKIRQVRSGIGHPDRQKRTLKALGFHRNNETIEVTATPQILGMIAKVNHLITVTEI